MFVSGIAAIADVGRRLTQLRSAGPVEIKVNAGNMVADCGHSLLYAQRATFWCSINSCRLYDDIWRITGDLPYSDLGSVRGLQDYETFNRSTHRRGPEE